MAHKRKSDWAAKAPMLLMTNGATHRETLAMSNFTPSGSRSIDRAAEVLTGGAQPTRKALPQLIPNGLTPDIHLQAALGTSHPLLLKAASTEPIDYALKIAPEDMNETILRRTRIAELSL